MTWPRGQTEQELMLRRLEKQFARLNHVQQSLVIHSYSEPSRQQWEAKYRQIFNGDAPIPPGMRLCWYDMRNGFIRQFTTTFDTENGSRSSGEIYAAVRNQRSSSLRFIGNMTVDGRVSPADNNHPNIVIGSNIVTHKRRGLLMLEMFIRLQHTFVDDGTRLWIDFGDTIVEPEMVSTGNNDFTRLYGRANDTTLSALQAFDNNFPQESEIMVLPEGPDAANGATLFPAILVHMKLFNPFNFLTPDDEFAQPTNVVGMGTIYHFANNLAAVSNGAIISHFMFQRLSPVKLGKDWRIEFREQTTTTDRVQPIRGDGWVYGYYNQAISESEEFTGVI